MTELERLTERIRSAMCGGWTEPSEIAERLIDEGVICPPCKVGDEVYVINEAGLAMPEYVGRENVVSIACFCTVTPYRTKTYDYKAIGKTVFFTREEAEDALAEANK